MKENVEYFSINDENQNYLNILPNSTNINSNTYRKEHPKFSDILSISSNPEEIFTLLYPIGHGGFGTVYKAIHNETKTIYAIKIINFINTLKNNYQKIFFNFNYSLAQQESTLMKLCHQSKYIINYYGSYYSKKTNTLWLILEYCPAGSIVDLMLSMNRTYTEEEISTIMKSVLKGLILIHSKNLIHRDIKAANIFLSENGFAKLGDFGVGTKLGIGDFFRNSKKGSPYWMSPQVVKNLDYDMKTDIWSLGITCCEMCNGEPPFAELNPQNVMEKIGTHPPKVDEIIKKEEHSKEFYDFIKKCLEVEPNKRPNARELIKHEFIVKYSKENNFIKELIEKHIEDIDKFRKKINANYNNNINNDNNEEKIDNKENNNEIEPEIGNINLMHVNHYHHEKNNESNITSHFNDDIKTNNFKGKENLLIKMISSSSHVNNSGINSTKDTQNQIKEEKKDKSSKNDYTNYPTFHKIEDENNINSESDSLEIIEIHNLCKSFDNKYFLKENKNSNNKKNSNKIKLTKKNGNIKEKLDLFLDINEDKEKRNQNNDKIIFKKKIRNKFNNKIFTYKNKIKSRNNINNKSSDNLFNNKTKYNLTNFVYVKTRIKKIEKNNFIFKKPIISYKNNKYNFNKTKDFTDNFLLDTQDEEGHINNTNLFNTKSNFNILKKNNEDNFSKTNYCFYKGLLKLDEIKIYKSDINNDSIDKKI